MVKQYLCNQPNGSQIFDSNFQAKNWGRGMLRGFRFFVRINLKANNLRVYLSANID